MFIIIIYIKKGGILTFIQPDSIAKIVAFLSQSTLFICNINCFVLKLCIYSLESARKLPPDLR